MPHESIEGSPQNSIPLDNPRASSDKSSRGSRRWIGLTGKSLMLGLGLVAAVWGIPKVAPYFYNPGGDLSIRTSCFDLEPETPYNSEYLGGEISVQLVSKHPD